MKNDKTKRSIDIVSTTGEVIQSLELSKVTEVNVDRMFIEIEQLRDGKWRMIYTKSLIPEIKNIDCLRIRRIDCGNI